MKTFAASFIVTFSSNTAVSPTITSLLPVKAITGKSPEGYEHIDVDAHFYNKNSFINRSIDDGKNHTTIWSGKISYCNWWQIELPYWFKVPLLPRILAI